MPPIMTKIVTSCDWVPSIVTEAMLKDYVKIGFLPAKGIIHWRSPNPGEIKPQPQDDEVIVFTDHMNRGFSPPGSKFFHDVLHFLQLHPQDIGPYSVPISAIFKSSVKCIFKKNPVLICSENFTT